MEDNTQWSCFACTYKNKGDNSFCEMCYTEKPNLQNESIPDNTTLVDKELPTTSITPTNNKISTDTSTLTNTESPKNALTLINTDQPTSNSILMKTKFSLTSSLTKTYQSMTVRHRRNNDKSEAERTFQTIIKNCQRTNTHFIDHEFPPSSSSLGDQFSHNVYQWLRISDIRSTSDDDNTLPWTVMSSPEPNDIEQGLLGNCWLVAALSLITERPRLLQHILLTKDINKEGVYLVRLCHNGIWKTIVVDDSFPCCQRRTLLFSKARRRQLYIPLIEKAYAKLFGSYSNLISGLMAEGLRLFTGASCEYIYLDKPDEPIDSDLTWAKLLSCCQANLLIGASTSRIDISEDVYDQIKINPNHAFSILTVHSLENDTDRFVLARDPHARSCYRDERVTPEVLAKLRTIHKAHRSTGAFWIEWTKFLRFFSTITISTYVSDHYDIREQASFSRSPTDPISAFYFHVPQPSLINISIWYHRHDRITDHVLTQLFVLCNVADESINTDNHNYILYSQSDPCLYWSGSLKPGLYTLIPFSTSFWHEYGQKKGIGDFTLVIHSSVHIEGIFGTEIPTFLTDCLIMSVIKSCKEPAEFENTTVYTTNKDQNITIIVIENQSPTHHLNFDIDMSSSRNIRHSRNSLVTHDCIPPGYRQLVCIVEWMAQVGKPSYLSYNLSRQRTKDRSRTVPRIDAAANDIHSWRRI